MMKAAPTAAANSNNPAASTRENELLLRPRNDRSPGSVRPSDVDIEVPGKMRPGLEDSTVAARGHSRGNPCTSRPPGFSAVMQTSRYGRQVFHTNSNVPRLLLEDGSAFILR